MLAKIELKEYGVKPVVVLSPTIRATTAHVLHDARLLILIVLVRGLIPPLSGSDICRSSVGAESL